MTAARLGVITYAASWPMTFALYWLADLARPMGGM